MVKVDSGRGGLETIVASGVVTYLLCYCGSLRKTREEARGCNCH